MQRQRRRYLWATLAQIIHQGRRRMILQTSPPAVAIGVTLAIRADMPLGKAVDSRTQLHTIAESVDRRHDNLAYVCKHSAVTPTLASTHSRLRGRRAVPITTNMLRQSAPLISTGNRGAGITMLASDVSRNTPAPMHVATVITQAAIAEAGDCHDSSALYDYSLYERSILYTGSCPHSRWAFI